MHNKVPKKNTKKTLCYKVTGHLFSLELWGSSYVLAKKRCRCFEILLSKHSLFQNKYYFYLYLLVTGGHVNLCLSKGHQHCVSIQAAFIFCHHPRFNDEDFFKMFV